MSALVIYPALGATVYDETGTIIPTTGLVITLSPYYVDMIRDGEISTTDPLGQDLAPENELSGGYLRGALVTDLTTRIGSFDGAVLVCSGYSTQLDGGGGTFRWVENSATASDSGTVIGNTGSGRWKRVYSGALNVRWFGAKGDGSTDDTAAIQSAVSALATAQAIKFPHCAGYATSAAITIPAAHDVTMWAPIIYTGSSNIAILTVGSAGVANSRATLQVQAWRQTVSDWSSESNIAIRLYNCDTCNVNVIWANRCTIGLQAIGDAAGFAYSKVTLGYLGSNKIGLDCRSVNVGWCNENLFDGGRFHVDTGVNRALSRYGVRFSTDGTYPQNNGNLFQKPSFELNHSNQTAGEAVPIVLEAAIQNEFNRCRFEDNSATYVRVSGTSSENHVSDGYGTLTRASVEDTSTYPITTITGGRHIMQRSSPLGLVFDTGPVARTVCYYDGSTTFNVPGLMGVDSGGTGVGQFAGGASIGSDYLELAASGLGRWVSTHTCKRFVVRRDVTAAAYGGRVVIRCFDSGGALLTNAGGGHPYVKTATAASVTYDSTGGGGYKTGSDSDEDFLFILHSDVKTIQVLMFGGTANLRLRSYKLYTLDPYDCASWVSHEQGALGENMGTAAPAAGTWVRGRRILHAEPSSGGVEGWVCVASGSPGTWKTFGVIA